jgi:DNA-binding beta-propeller fold protein YncE
VTAGTSSQYIYAGSAGRGAISQLPDTSFALASPLAPPPIFENACVSVAGPENTCVNGVAMNSVDALSLSRDGGTLYAASTASGAVDTFAVDPASGALTQTGCLMRNPPPGPCRASQLLDAPTAVAASPDGRTVYAADTGGSSGDRLVALLRDPATGQLRDGSCYDELPLPGSRSGAGAPDPCHSLPGLDNVQSVAVSPDSTTVYTVGDNALAVLVRDPATGQLIETACAVPLDQRCSDPVGLSGGRSVVASPDGMNIYAAAANAAAVTAWGQGASVTSGRASGALAYLTVSCPATSATHCMGMATLGRLAMWHASVTAISTRAQFVVAPGAVATVRVRLAQRLAKEAATGHVLVVQALVLPELGGGGGSSRTIALVPSR